MSVREIWKLLWKYLHVMVIQVYKFVQVMGILKLDKSKFLQRKFLIMYNLNRIIFSLVASTLKESWLVYLPWSLSLSCHLAGVFPCVGEVSKTNRTHFHITSFTKFLLHHCVHSQNKQLIVYTEICLKTFAIAEW